MDIGNSTAIGNTSGSSLASASLAENFDTFLTLLTTQLQNQDPLEPLDTNEFTDQLVSFTSVEQEIATNKNLEQLLQMFAASQNADLVNYLGKTVDVVSEITELSEGKASWSYALDGKSESTQLLIFDENDKLVYKTEGETDSGLHDFVWNGEDNNGDPLPDGLYRLEIAALDSDDNEIATAIKTSGPVTSFEVVDGNALITVNGVKVPVQNVLKVSVTESI